MTRAKRARRGSSGRRFTVALTPLGWAAATALAWCLLAQLEHLVWLGALAAELGFQILLATLVLSAVALLRRDWLAGGLALTAVALSGGPLLRLVRPQHPTPSAGPTLRLLAAHLADPLAPAALLSHLVESKIQMAALTADDPQALERALGALPGFELLHATEPQGSGLLFVREQLLPRRRGKARRSDGAIELQVGACGLEVRVIDLPEVFAYGQRKRREQSLAALARTPPKAARAVWLGHLGSRVEAADLAPLLASQALRDARLGHGRLATFPAALGPMGVPREHLLLHGWLRVTSLSVDAPLNARAQRTLHATIELTEPRCRLPH